MGVKLVAYTAPSLEMEDMHTIQDIVAYCARVSNPANQENYETSEKLLKYLVKHKHWSPFEMVNVVLEINTTRDIARQILRHRSFTFQEFSQRYAEPGQLGYTLREARLQDTSNRQNSILTNDEELQEWWLGAQQHVLDVANDIYTQALRRGIAKEVARSVEPEGLTNSRMYMNGTVRSWIHYCELRSGVETQKEHRSIALEAISSVASIFPLMEQCFG